MRPRAAALHLIGGLHGASGDAVSQGGVSYGRPGPPEGEAPLKAQRVGLQDGASWPHCLRVIAPYLHECCGARQRPA